MIKPRSVWLKLWDSQTIMMIIRMVTNTLSMKTNVTEWALSPWSLAMIALSQNKTSLVWCKIPNTIGFYSINSLETNLEKALTMKNSLILLMSKARLVMILKMKKRKKVNHQLIELIERLKLKGMKNKKLKSKSNDRL